MIERLKMNRKKTKFIVRSQNNEALHFLEEEGVSLKNYLIYGAKMYTEKNDFPFKRKSNI